MAAILATIIVLATFFIVAGALTNKPNKGGRKVSTFKALSTLSFGGCLLVVLVIMVLGLVIGLVSGVLNVL